jgi:nitrite reductase/ring-hydroxylating ferredoxin subunit
MARIPLGGRMDQDLANIRQPIERAWSPSNSHYTDPALYAEEREALLFAGCAGLAAADVPLSDDARPIDFAGVPLLLLRGRKGRVRVFQNVCRHRGMILVCEPRRIEGAIRCPYHSWRYGLDGRLVATPHVGGPGQNIHPDIRREELGLIEVRSHVWRDVVFVNLSGQGSGLYRQIAGEAGEVFPDFPDLNPKWQNALEYIALFPGMLLVAQRDHAFALVLLPEGPARTVEHIHLYYALPDTSPARRAKNAALWRTVFGVEGPRPWGERHPGAFRFGGLVRERARALRRRKLVGIDGAVGICVDRGEGFGRQVRIGREQFLERVIAAAVGIGRRSILRDCGTASEAQSGKRDHEFVHVVFSYLVAQRALLDPRKTRRGRRGLFPL